MASSEDDVLQPVVNTEDAAKIDEDYFWRHGRANGIVKDPEAAEQQESPELRGNGKSAEDTWASMPDPTLAKGSRDETADATEQPAPSRAPMARSNTDAVDWSKKGVEPAEMQSEGQPVKKTTTNASAPKRPSIGNSTQTERPKPTPRNNTLRRNFRRAATSTQAGTRRNQFEDESSSSSSSSSSDEEAPVKRKRKQQQGEGLDGEASQTKANTQANKAKRNRKPGEPSSKFMVGNEHLKTKGRVSKRDGRLNISINEAANSGYVAKAFGQNLKHHLDIPHRRQREEGHDHTEHEKPRQSPEAEAVAKSLGIRTDRPSLNIVIMVIGSRGDIQPFLKVGKVLKEKYGHRVRIATHSAFRDFVQKDSGLEFFNVGGNPSELMAFMVKNPGLIPSMQTVKEGEIGRRRDQMAEMFEGFWRACINTTDDEHDKQNLKMLGDRAPFIADALIANPPSFAHVHIAERLGIPLHMMFTFPYSPTQQFPHPLANIKPQKSNVSESYVNFMSYPLVETMTFQGLGDLINRFRVKSLGLEPVSQLWAPGALYRMKVPYTYMWSPTLVPKPKDWGPEIDIGGFVFLDLASDFKPPKDLQDFLDAGPPPVYIGFGSIVVDDPDRFTKMIFKATEMAGVRALVNKGWGGLGGEGKDTPDHVYMLGNTPHDWLFPRVKAVVHHGGAGTTAIGLRCAKPTMIVPFFGDQPFWGAMVAEAKAGAHECIPYKKLNAERLADGIKQCLTDEAQANVQKIADSIEAEGDGAENAVKSFHRSLPLAGSKSMRCSILEERIAVWKVRNSSLRLSALAAELLVEEGKVKWHDLKLIRHCEWNDFDGPGEPMTGTASALTSSLYGIGEGVGMVPVRIAKHVKKREEHDRKKEEKIKRREERKQRRAAQAQPQAESKGKDKDKAIDRGHATAPTAAANAETEGDATGSGLRPTATRGGTNTTQESAMSSDPEEPLAQEVAEDIGNGFKRSGTALLTMPMDLHLAIAQGFHNAPRLWGDATVRKPTRITGLKSGWTAARREFGYDIYDGWTGLVTQPMGGWKDEDSVPTKFAGMGKGVAKGVGGLVLKNVTAIVAPPAFLGMGVRKYVEKKFGGPGTNALIRKALIIRGVKDRQALESGGQDSQEIEDLRKTVDESWHTYEQIWQEVHRFQRSAGTGPVGRVKLARERKKWEEVGALENTGTAERALKAYKEGQDVEDLFAARRREIELVEAPRAPAMQGDDGEERLPNGRRKASAVLETDGASDANHDIGKIDEADEEKSSVRPSRGGSDTTVVNSENSGAEKGKAKEGNHGGAELLQSAGAELEKGHMKAKKDLDGAGLAQGNGMVEV